MSEQKPKETLRTWLRDREAADEELCFLEGGLVMRQKGSVAWIPEEALEATTSEVETRLGEELTRRPDGRIPAPHLARRLDGFYLSGNTRAFDFARALSREPTKPIQGIRLDPGCVRPDETSDVPLWIASHGKQYMAAWLAAHGAENERIARRLGLSENTTRTYLSQFKTQRLE